MPLVVLAAILVTVSLRLVDRRSLHVLRLAFTASDPAERRRSLRDGAVILAVFLATVLGQPVVGVAVGVGLSCALFMADMSRPVISRRWDGVRSPSRRPRSPAERALLSTRPGAIVVLDLEGVLFFGNSHSLAADLRSVRDETRVVILDRSRLGDVDTSGQTTLGEAAARLSNQGKALVLAGVDPAWPGCPRGAAGAPLDRTFLSVDAALEWAEDRILVEERSGIEDDLSAPGSRVLRPGPTEISWFRQNLRSVRYPSGTILCRKGDESDCLWILERGFVSVRISGNGDGLPVAKLGPGCSVGEMGLLEGRPRSANVVAEDDVDAWVLSNEELARLLAREPRIGQPILSLIASQLSERLRETTKPS